MRATAPLAALVSLGLVSAAAPTSPAGTAKTELTALEASITGVPTPVGATVLDVTSYASTDVGARNPAGKPFAQVAAVPLDIGGQTVGAVTARSDNGGGHRGQSIERSAGPLTASVGSLDLQATAKPHLALAALKGATANLAALDRAIGVAVNDAGTASRVDTEAASAVQALVVSGLSVQLGDLLDVGALPLDVVIDLAEQLSGVLSGTLGDLAQQVGALADRVEAELAELGAAQASYAADSAELKKLLGDQQLLNSQITALKAQLAEAEALLGTGATEDTVTDLVDETNDLIDDTQDTIGGIVGVLHHVNVAQLPTTDEQLQSLIDQLEAQIAAAEAAAAELVAQIEALVDTLVATLTTIAAGASTLDGLVDQLVAALQDLLAQLPDVLGALADADLVRVGRIVVGVTARATAAGGEAVLGCAVDGVALAGLTLPAPDCAEPLGAGSAALAGAVGKLKGVLSALPVVGGVVPDVRLEMFADARKATGRDGAYRTAEAHVTALDLELPSLDLGAVTDGLLDGLGDAELSALLGDIEELLGVDAADPLFDTLTELAAAIDATLVTVRGAVSSVVDVEAVVRGILAGLPAADALAGVTTPGLRVVVDPTSRAEFRPAGSVPGSGGGSDPNPVPGGNLPHTGGGLALLGALTAAGGAGLWWRMRRAS